MYRVVFYFGSLCFFVFRCVYLLCFAVSLCFVGVFAFVRCGYLAFVLCLGQCLHLLRELAFLSTRSEDRSLVSLTSAE